MPSTQLTMSTSPSKRDFRCGSALSDRFVPPSYLLDSPRGRRLSVASWPELEGKATPRDTDVLIVGGGLAGVSLGSHLFHLGIDFLLVDPARHLGRRFLQRTGAIGQTTLRSPYAHYVGCQSSSDLDMLDFAKLHWHVLEDYERDQVRLATAGLRAIVPMDVFEGHLRHTVAAHGLDGRHVVDRVESVDESGGGFAAALSSGRNVRARAVVLATGEGTSAVQTGDPRVVRWDDDAALSSEAERVLVVGGGQSAATLALALLRRGKRVTLAYPADELHFQCLDFTADLFEPSGRLAYADHPEDPRFDFAPSVIHEFRHKLEAYEARGRLDLLNRARLVDAGGVACLDRDGRREGIDHDMIVPCFGLVPEADVVGLGVTVGTGPRRNCELGRRVYTVGPLCKRVVGPIARAIEGQRVAVDRVAASIVGDLDA